MRELTEGEQTSTQKGKRRLELSADEQGAIAKSEGEATPDQRRQQYIQWAAEINKDEEWIDKIFTFLPNGAVVAEENLNILDKESNILPPWLIEVKGRLSIIRCGKIDCRKIPRTSELTICKNKLDSLEGLPSGIEYLDATGNELTSCIGIPEGVKDLHLDQNQITSCRGIPDNVETITMSDNPIESFADIPDNIGMLVIRDIMVDKQPNVESLIDFPEGRNINEIYVDGRQMELAGDLMDKGYNVQGVVKEQIELYRAGKKAQEEWNKSQSQ